MQIPKRDSRPADPSEPSFLDRPGEIRNLIYDQVFKRGEPILLHNIDAYHAVEPKRMIHDTDEDFNDAIARFDTDFESSIGADDEFAHGLHFGLPLLLACRQIYHEAASVFYGDNTFIFSRVLNRHDDSYNPYYRGFDGDAYNQFAYASTWLSNIGSQFGMLKKVHIDVDAMCDWNCQHAITEFDALPLLRLLWKNGSKKSPITFACTGRRLHIECVTGSPRPTEEKKRQYSEGLVNELNSMISSLIGKGHFSLYKFANFDRLIHSVTIVLSECYMKVTFDSDHSHWIELAVAEDGVVNVRARSSKPRHLLGLPRSVLSKIINMAVLPPQGPTLDMDSRTVYGLQLSALQLNKLSRFNFGHMLTHSTNVTIARKSTERMTSFEHFDFLQVWRNTSPCSYFAPRSWSNSTMPVNIALAFETAAATTLSKLCINIKGLVKAMRGVRKEHITISISLKPPGGDPRIQFQSGRISLPRLERRVFLLLSDAMAGRLVADDKIPDIWMDGHGELISACHPDSGTAISSGTLNRHSKLKPAEIEWRGYQFARDLPDKWGTPGTCFHTWSQLRSEYWPDWQAWAHRRRL
jgi:hypothetical protein